MKINNFHRKTIYFGNKPLSKITSNFIIKNKSAQNILKFANNNTSLFSGLFSFCLATTIRPLTILIMPSKNKEDNKYAIAKSISTGVVDALGSMIFFIPINRILKHNQNILNKDTNTVYINNKITEGLINISNRSARLITAPIQASILYNMLPEVLKKVFPNKGIKNENK